MPDMHSICTWRWKDRPMASIPISGGHSEK